jgi:TonB-dependent SusC/RagA subfamily outer membrane receptor
MRKIFFTIFLLQISSFGFSQSNDRIVLPGFDVSNQISGTCSNFQPCGMVRRYAEANRYTTTSKQDSGVIKVCTRCINSGIPLYVVDGIAILNPNIAELMTKEIKGVSVLKGADAMTMFGSQGINGVILITTNKSLLRKFIIKDSLDGSPVTGATVMFMAIGRMEVSMAVADSNGIVVPENLDPAVNYIMNVSAVGYNTLSQVIEKGYHHKEQEILLQRELKNCDEVVLTSIDCFKCRKGGCICPAMRSYRFANRNDTMLNQNMLKIFPNPAQKGNMLNLQFNNDNGKEKTIRVVSLDGKILFQQLLMANGRQDVFQLPTNSCWSAGIYFIQLLYENGQVAASEKIILQ